MFSWHNPESVGMNAVMSENAGALTIYAFLSGFIEWANRDSEPG